MDSRDIIGSVLVALLGLLVFSMALGYGIGTFSEMGPGFFPALLGGAAMVLGATIGLQAMRGKGGGLPQPAWRPLLGVAAAVAAFALTVDRLGALPAVALAAVLVGVSSADGRWTEIALLAVSLMVLVWAVFFQLLGMPLTAFRLP